MTRKHRFATSALPPSVMSTLPSTRPSPILTALSFLLLLVAASAQPDVYYRVADYPHCPITGERPEDINAAYIEAARIGAASNGAAVWQRRCAMEDNMTCCGLCGGEELALRYVRSNVSLAIETLGANATAAAAKLVDLSNPPSVSPRVSWSEELRAVRGRGARAEILPIQQALGANAAAAARKLIDLSHPPSVRHVMPCRAIRSAHICSKWSCALPSVTQVPPSILLSFLSFVSLLSLRSLLFLLFLLLSTLALICSKWYRLGCTYLHLSSHSLPPFTCLFYKGDDGPTITICEGLAERLKAECAGTLFYKGDDGPTITICDGLAERLKAECAGTLFYKGDDGPTITICEGLAERLKAECAGTLFYKGDDGPTITICEGLAERLKAECAGTLFGRITITMDAYSFTTQLLTAIGRNLYGIPSFSAVISFSGGSRLLPSRPSSIPSSSPLPLSPPSSPLPPLPSLPPLPLWPTYHRCLPPHNHLLPSFQPDPSHFPCRSPTTIYFDPCQLMFFLPSIPSPPLQSAVPLRPTYRRCLPPHHHLLRSLHPAPLPLPPKLSSQPPNRATPIFTTLTPTTNRPQPL
ncbi:unnamed protein product [Closterium sp. Naga37s-1]|nr:unnamed protein product [Closterium sp. Naga37s-1]